MPISQRGLAGVHGSVTGPGAAAVKYDLVTALLVLAAQGPPVEARLALRLSLTITARYNWRTGTFSVGLKELASLWGVTDRTAKREIAAMRAQNWLRVSRPAARGRVASYAIEFETVLRATMPFWAAVGPDYAARMVGVPEPDTPTNVVPLRQVTPEAPEPNGTCWPKAAKLLREQDPATYGAWFAHLRVADHEAGVLTLVAPSRFVADYVRTHFQTRLQAVLAQAGEGGLREVRIVEG